MEILKDYNREEVREPEEEVYMQLYYKNLRNVGIEMEGYDPIYDLIDDESMEVGEIIEVVEFMKEEQSREERTG